MSVISGHLNPSGWLATFRHSFEGARTDGNSCRVLAPIRELVERSHLQHGQHEGQGPFGALIVVDPVLVQSVVTAAAGGIVEQLLQLVLTQKPVEGVSRAGHPDAFSSRSTGCSESASRIST